MKPKINFITVAVADLAKSKDFYKNTFNFRVSEETSELCLFELDDNFYFVIQQQSELIHQTGDTGADSFSSRFILSHNAASRQEVENILAVAVENGAVRIKTIDESWGYSVTLKDVDNHCWEILYSKEK